RLVGVAGLLLFLVPIGLVGACDQPSSQANLKLTVPQGLLDGASAELLVIDAEAAACDPNTGLVTPEGADAQTFPLTADGCAEGAVACTEIRLDQDGKEKVFQMVATRGDRVVAQGCSTVAVDQDPLDVAIRAVANLPPTCCNDGALQIGEQCDTGAAAPDFCGTPNAAPATGSCTGIFTDAVCECDCLAREVLLSVDDPDMNQPGLFNGAKTQVTIAFGGSNSADLPNALRAVFTDTSNPSDLALNYRILDGSLYPTPNALFHQQLRVKPTCVGAELDTPDEIPFSQHQPDLARISDSLLGLVFADDGDNGITPGQEYNVHLLLMNEYGCTETLDTLVNAGAASSSPFPAIAGGPSNTALIVWTRGGTLQGRVWSNGANSICDTCLPNAADLDIAAITPGTRGAVAGNANGWVVAYTAPGVDSDIFVRTIGTSGTLGEPQQVNDRADGPQVEPRVAMLEDGRFAVVWNDGGAIMMQRFSADAQPLAGDQDAAMTILSPPGVLPAIAGGNDSGGFFAAVWSSQTDGTAWARFIGAGNDRYLRNPIDGEFTDFLVSHPSVGGARLGADVAIGGNGFVAFAWEDISAEHAGIFVRRFPVPSAFGL
ncbi:MAG: hypothetical protein KC731_37640, partial [Myxococcales bacterium]|nr:hypothetical protein [Myxococcales bacterium]